MSLDVYIKYKQPKKRTVKKGMDGVACGSTIAVYPEDIEVEETEWHSNITHNMAEMAMHIPVSYQVDGETYENDLYYLVWRPEEVGIGNVCNNTITVAGALQTGITYMISHREELLKYNPNNGWGDYDSFLEWLLSYWRACLENPECKIEVSR